MSQVPNRVSPEGKFMGERLSRLTDIEVGKLIAQGEWKEDERCASCAFRYGTVPNGCAQTQLDALKCVVEHQPFNCHVPKGNLKACEHTCMGWFAAMQVAKKRPAVKAPWEFSPSESTQ